MTDIDLRGAVREAVGALLQLPLTAGQDEATLAELAPERLLIHWIGDEPDAGQGCHRGA